MLPKDPVVGNPATGLLPPEEAFAVWLPWGCWPPAVLGGWETAPDPPPPPLPDAAGALVGWGWAAAPLDWAGCCPDLFIWIILVYTYIYIYIVYSSLFHLFRLKLFLPPCSCGTIK